MLATNTDPINSFISPRPGCRWPVVTNLDKRTFDLGEVRKSQVELEVLTCVQALVEFQPDVAAKKKTHAEGADRTEPAYLTPPTWVDIEIASLHLPLQVDGAEGSGRFKVAEVKRPRLHRVVSID